MLNRFLSRQAFRDLNEIWEYIAADSVGNADQVIEKIEAAIRQLSKKPKLGHYREDLADKRHRFYCVYSYLIVYRYEKKSIEVARVLHASRDANKLL